MNDYSDMDSRDYLGILGDHRDAPDKMIFKIKNGPWQQFTGHYKPTLAEIESMAQNGKPVLIMRGVHYYPVAIEWPNGERWNQ